MERIVLFDGVCNLCNDSVQFILKRDINKSFKFASLQGETGQKLLNQYGLNPAMNSFVLIENNKPYLKSTAALRVCRKLRGTWRLFSLLILIPKPFRDFVYGVIANNRYKWFGKIESCLLPSPEWKDRFLD
ncbi:thiol-disulfide oxidoreductase DCC family protein [Paenibacillus sp. BSR1-1]|uniref:thiol-disulfide oxidoreductase DCC family protein n=1 Tax=Paenibacillus sp. BSR1-1 TaxID=3020845 RepID=UPI0025B21D21|nr:thiol-disulfide oxidoreductase DCC family protein [Paenibacillus sp. BSR1-1]MDN3016013.1 thiol-disulfide oxidoreductase DCC family protein [Paenibacillus sp. BSR1-1]